jgi:hypothetical protein
MALRRDVQEQNQATRDLIAKTALSFRSMPMDLPWLLSELQSRGFDPLSGILAALYDTPEQGGTLYNGQWVTSDRQFFRFKGSLTYGTRADFHIEEWEKLTPKVSAHERGTGKTFAFLALEVLEQLSPRPNISLERTREG